MVVSNANHARFRAAPWYGEPLNLTVGGAGGIGSWLTLMLARGGHYIQLYDYDRIDRTNMAGQLYATTDIGSLKADTAARIAIEFCGDDLVSNYGKFERGYSTRSITFACFDSMSARKLMFNEWKRRNKYTRSDRPCLFIDGRMEAESFQVYCVTPKDADRYEATLFNDNEVEDAPCSMKATSHMGAHISAVMTEYFNNHVANVRTGFNDRDVPFSHVWHSPMAYLEQEF